MLSDQAGFDVWGGNRLKIGQIGFIELVGKGVEKFGVEDTGVMKLLQGIPSGAADQRGRWFR